MSVSTLSLDTVEGRAFAVSEAVHSHAMEGLEPSPELLADAEDYIAGLIDEEELLQRTRKRYGLA
ncbi:antitoxin VbhA family protein [Schaalia sp. ZJ1691]|uniref:antitoxin VbhA family protein n=1 Tax=Schaalia sp. ZJ1691 TaxID=2709404 RepID=UPI00197E7826|nr:antitoxin VbhA family protein [Schaalia sp. ZJ1691]